MQAIGRLIGEASINGFNLWPPIIAVALTASPLIVLIIGLGYLLNGFQIVCNCYIGMTRVMVAMSLDRVLPEWFSKVDERLHTPVNAHLAYFLASIPVILALQPGDPALQLGQPDTGRDVWLRLRVHHHLPCRRACCPTAPSRSMRPRRARSTR